MGENMDKDKIKKLLDDIDASCQEGWDDDQRGNFFAHFINPSNPNLPPIVVVTPFLGSPFTSYLYRLALGLNTI